ncbi:MAG: UDP-2,3-diacylglucosamine diphosphatase [Methylophaga sp.]|nr:MAG: UDP-2,3-diacylglucosamine diphosphatase [Methylophaga sp.]
MSTLFISDLHLNPTNPALTQLAVSFLKTTAIHYDAVYILGDLFNVWLGDDLIPDEFNPIIEQLQKLHNANIKTYLMVGNRDFMMGKDFAKLIGAELLSDECVIDLYGTQTLLLHGDALCTDDIAYQRYRRWSRNKFLQWVYRHMPLSYRQGLAAKIKQQSKQQKQTKSAVTMDVNDAEVNKTMKKFGVTQLIHGHTHRPAIHDLKIAGKPATRIVLGDWVDEVSYLHYDKQQLALVDYRINEKRPL